MMDTTPLTEALSIVVAGKFNPVIITPAWLANQELASPEEAEAAEVTFIHPDVSDFALGAKRIQVLRDRMSVSTTDVRYEEPLRDLAVGVLELLRHTPTSAVGLNYEGHFTLPSVEAWHARGDTLAPKDHWKGLLAKPGLIRMTMRDEERAPAGYTDVTVGPSGVAKLRVFVNDHYQLDAPDADKARDVIMKNWRSSIVRSRKVALRLANEDG